MDAPEEVERHDPVHEFSNPGGAQGGYYDIHCSCGDMVRGRDGAKSEAAARRLFATHVGSFK